MFRAILYVIVAVLAISMLRAIVGALGRMFGDFVNPSQRPSAPHRPAVPTGGELKKDPVCGTFISAATAIQKRIGPEVYYFCSAQCRDKFKA
jgi:YHS domain-containing protein